jgi:hypothetical protein
LASSMICTPALTILRNPGQSPDLLLARGTADAQMWSDFLSSSGGALEFPKCAYRLTHYGFTDAGFPVPQTSTTNQRYRFKKHVLPHHTLFNSILHMQLEKPRDASRVLHLTLSRVYNTYKPSQWKNTIFCCRTPCGFTLTWWGGLLHRKMETSTRHPTCTLRLEHTNLNTPLGYTNVFIMTTQLANPT